MNRLSNYTAGLTLSAARSTSLSARLSSRLGQLSTSGVQLIIAVVAAQTESAEGWWVGLGLIAMTSLTAWIITEKRRRSMSTTPTSCIGSAAQGQVEIEGKGLPLGGLPLLSPASGLQCLWYRYKIEEKRGRDKEWHIVEQGESDSSILIDDGTGSCLVDPEGAEIHPGAASSWTRDNRRYTEWSFIPGTRLYVLGYLRSQQSTLDLSVGEDVKHLLEEWKRDRPTLLQRFDLNQDGEISMAEWELARCAARREVEHNHQQLRQHPEIHCIGASDHGPYIISNRPEAELNRYYARWSLFHLVVFFTSLVALHYVVRMLG